MPLSHLEYSPRTGYPLSSNVRGPSGCLLLLNPILVGALDLGDPNHYRYEATRVASANGSVDVPAEVGRVDPDVLCLRYPITIRQRTFR